MEREGQCRRDHGKGTKVYSRLKGMCCSQPCVLDVVFFTRVSAQSKSAYVPDGQDGVKGGWGGGLGRELQGVVGWVRGMGVGLYN